MTQEQRKEIEISLKENYVAVSTRFKKVGIKETGTPLFKTLFVDDDFQKVPNNYKQIEIISEYNCAILEDLDYKAVQDEPTNNA